jgi:chromosome segregation ATPase
MNKINILSVRNTNKKLKRRDKQILKLKSENDILHSKLQSLNKSVKSVKDKYSNLKALSYYYKGKTNTQKEKIAQSVNENENLKKSIEILKDQNANLSLEFSKISSKIETYQKGKYTDEIRLVCYELLNKGVSTKNIPEVIKFVLKSLASLEVDRLPKPTLLKYMSTEAGS